MIMEDIGEAVSDFDREIEEDMDNMVTAAVQRAEGNLGLAKTVSLTDVVRDISTSQAWSFLPASLRSFVLTLQLDILHGPSTTFNADTGIVHVQGATWYLAAANRVEEKSLLFDIDLSARTVLERFKNEFPREWDRHTLVHWTMPPCIEQIGIASGETVLTEFRKTMTKHFDFTRDYRVLSYHPVNVLLAMAKGSGRHTAYAAARMLVEAGMELKCVSLPCDYEVAFYNEIRAALVGKLVVGIPVQAVCDLVVSFLMY